MQTYKEKLPNAVKTTSDSFIAGPSGESRTHGLLNPIQARYQTALHPDFCNVDILSQETLIVKCFFLFFKTFFACVRLFSIFP